MGRGRGDGYFEVTFEGRREIEEIGFLRFEIIDLSRIERVFIYVYVYIHLAVKKAVLHGTTFDTPPVVKRSHSLRVKSIAIYRKKI